jgi:hypothetical protein
VNPRIRAVVGLVSYRQRVPVGRQVHALERAAEGDGRCLAVATEVVAKHLGAVGDVDHLPRGVDDHIGAVGCRDECPVCPSRAGAQRHGRREDGSDQPMHMFPLSPFAEDTSATPVAPTSPRRGLQGF